MEQMGQTTRRAVLTSDRHAWLLGGFFHQWEKYDGRPIEVVGFTPPAERLLAGHPFISLGEFKDYPIERWSDGLIAYLERLSEPLVEIWLEDYWLMRASGQIALRDAAVYMALHPEIVRFDLATDRLYAAGMRYIDTFRSVNIIEAPGSQYQLSFQASLWRRAGLLELLTRHETPWQAELNGTRRLNESAWRVVGTWQEPVSYMIVVNKGKLDRSGEWMYPPRTLSAEDWAELDSMGFTSQTQTEGEYDRPAR